MVDYTCMIGLQEGTQAAIRIIDSIVDRGILFAANALSSLNQALISNLHTSIRSQNLDIHQSIQTLAHILVNVCDHLTNNLPQRVVSKTRDYIIDNIPVNAINDTHQHILTNLPIKVTHTSTELITTLSTIAGTALGISGNYGSLQSYRLCMLYIQK